MKADRIFTLLCALAFFGTLLAASTGLGAAANPTLAKAKQDAEAKGYLFVASKEEIIANAKKEGNLRVLGSLDKATLNVLAEAFKKKYPFINARADEINGTEVYLRMIQEMKAGLAKNWDVNYLAFDYYNDYLPYQKKFDILGMAQHGVLQIPVKMIDPMHRHVIVVASDLQVVAYNSKLWPAEKIPNTWEGFLREEFKDKKFMLDIRPKDLAALVPAWGLEKTLDYARKLAAQNPVWVRGNARAMPLVLSGERPILFGPNLGTVMEAYDKDPTKTVAYKIIEPVPTRLNEAQAILGAAPNPHAALLWLEFVVSPEGQALLDKHEPYGASLLTPGSVQEKLTKGLKLSILDWDHYTKMGDYEKKIVEAYGFPRAGK
ncbi:MAG TPA: extracellular solute-binding protein [Candidatus Acidoferrales bacterium]|nr:extracellular solute-binding protein [Candidatus Acidoferrales bacterium]